MSGATHPVLISYNLSFSEFINFSSNKANREKSSRLATSQLHSNHPDDQMFGLLELSSQCEIISVSAGRKLLCEFLLVPGQYSAHNKV